jgi:hypothetical protein
MTLQDKLDAIKARADAVTPGWTASSQDMIVDAALNRIAKVLDLDDVDEYDNQRFIAAARDDVPRLVNALTECMSQRDELEQGMADQFSSPPNFERYNTRLLAILEGEDE